MYRPGLISLMVTIFSPLTNKSLAVSLLNLKKSVKKYRIKEQLNQKEIKELKNKIEKYYIKVRISTPNTFIIDNRYEQTMEILSQSYDSGKLNFNLLKSLPRLDSSL